MLAVTTSHGLSEFHPSKDTESKKMNFTVCKSACKNDKCKVCLMRDEVQRLKDDGTHDVVLVRKMCTGSYKKYESTRRKVEEALKCATSLPQTACGNNLAKSNICFEVPCSKLSEYRILGEDKHGKCWLSQSFSGSCGPADCKSPCTPKEKTSPLHRPSPFSMPEGPGIDKELSALFGNAKPGMSGKAIGKPHRGASKPRWCDGSCCYPIAFSCKNPQRGWKKVCDCILNLCIIMLIAYMAYFCCCCCGEMDERPAQILVISGGGTPPAASPSPRADVGNFGEVVHQGPVHVATLAERPLLADNLVSRSSLEDVRITVPEIEPDTTTPRPDEVAKVFEYDCRVGSYLK